MGKKYSPNLAPAVGSSLPKLLANMIQFGPPSLNYLPRAMLVALVSAIGVPFRNYERLITKPKVAKLHPGGKLAKDPIFILGHWRSGTTHIHNLICKDPQFGFISLDHALFPRSFLTTGLFRLFLKNLMPETRPMDNMKLSLDAPQEDELALSNLSRFSFYNGWQFPRHVMEFYKNYVEFKNTEPTSVNKALSAWWDDYHQLLLRASYHKGGRQLVLKNPPNTARIPHLLKRYPNARFIHIYRNPYKVFLSTVNLYHKAVVQFNFQRYKPEEMERDLLEIYQRMMKAYFRDRELIPAENLFELRYEEAEGQTMEVLAAIYSKLGLGSFEKARPGFEAYLNSLGHYTKNSFHLAPEKIQLVKSHWGFALDEWGYELPS